MISREGPALTPTYLDNAKIVYDTIANDNGANAIRVTIVKYDLDEDEYSVKWSQVRGSAGTESLAPLETADVKNAHDQLPIMGDGEELILVQACQSTRPSSTWA